MPKKEKSSLRESIRDRVFTYFNGRDATLNQAAEYLQVCRTTVWRMVSDGRLDAYKVGTGNIRVRLESIVRLTVGGKDA